MKDRRGRERSAHQTFNDLPSETVQTDAHLADINKILGKYREFGITDSLNLAEKTFRDVTELPDYSEAMREIRKAEMQFMELPSKVREMFNHDVAEWLDAAEDPEKRHELVRKGFIKDLENPEHPSPAGEGSTDPSPPTPETSGTE